MSKRGIFVWIDSELLAILDKQSINCKSSGRSFNRSAVIADALDYYFKVKLGIPYIFGKKK